MTLQSIGYDLYQRVFRLFMALVEREYVPDFIIRRGIQFLLSQRLQEGNVPHDQFVAGQQAFVEELKTLPIALHTDAANEQHYELPTEYFSQVLGRWKKYSSCLFTAPGQTLDQAEENMLAVYCSRLKLTEGVDVLELGCGWGSFSLYAAKAFPSATFTAVSNSRTQKVYIDSQAQAMGLTNLTVITANMVDFDAPRQYDRVVSVEMFEHMKNYKELMRRVSTWMKEDALFFCHVFCHKHYAYHFEDNGEEDWMTRYFFKGGTMPSLELFLHFQENLSIKQLWYINGSHYSKTLEAWLVLQDAKREELWPVFEATYGADAQKWWVYWRLFYLACSELFNYSKGEEWGVGHYLFEKKSVVAAGEYRVV